MYQLSFFISLLTYCSHNVNRGPNWWRATCNFFLWISSAVKLLKHMRPLLPRLRFVCCLFWHMRFLFDLAYEFVALCTACVAIAALSFLWTLLNLVQVQGNENPSILISFATKSSNAGQVTSKLHVIELGAQPGTVFSLKILLLMYVDNLICLKEWGWYLSIVFMHICKRL